MSLNNNKGVKHTTISTRIILTLKASLKGVVEQSYDKYEYEVTQ